MTPESTTDTDQRLNNPPELIAVAQPVPSEFNPDLYTQSLLEFAAAMPDQPELIPEFKIFFAEKLQITDAELHQLKPADYLTYLKACEYCDLNLAYSHIQVIANRYSSDFEQLQKLSHEHPDQYDDILALSLDCTEQTNHLIWLFSHNPDTTLPPHIIEQLFVHIQHPAKLMRLQTIEMLDNLICHDLNNGDESVQLLTRAKQLALEYVISDNPDNYDTSLNLLDVFYAYHPGLVPQLFIEAIQSYENPQQARQIYHAFANRLYNGPAQAIKLLIESNLASQATSFLQALEFIPETSEAASDQELYNKFDIGHWDPNNQVLTEELELLEESIPNDKPILDIACGQGRHLIPLMATHPHIIGTDINFHNIKELSRNHPQSNVAVASWYHLPFPNQSFESIICLGRSAPHITTSSQWCQFLSEVSRVGNELFIDFPDSHQGFAKEQINRFDQTSIQLDALSSQPGIHIGTPDHQHFTPRFIPDDEYIRAVAQLNGWSAQKIHQIEYTDQTGQKNTNYYWHFTKAQTQLSFDEYTQAAGIVFPIQSELKPTWITLD